MSKKVVIAIGGNSLIKDKNHQDFSHQLAAVKTTAQNIAAILGLGYEVIITHGNGPQVGFSLLRSEMAKGVAPENPLAVCGAETQGSIGYMIQQALKNILKQQGLDKQVATVLTQVEVAQDDPAFLKPTKPIGPFYNQEEALLKKELGWNLIEDAKRGYRRVVASPLPRKIIEKEVIECLVQNGVCVISCGGGGIPVIRNEEGLLTGIPAVIDKDHVSSLLATAIKADILIISTAVEKIALNFGQTNQHDLSTIDIAAAEQYLKEGHFHEGSMKPKVEAALNFLHNGGQKAIITNPQQLIKAVKGQAGTIIFS